MTYRTLFLLAGLPLSAALPLQAQGGGMLNDRVQYQVIVGPRIGSQHAPLRAIILWRGEPGWSQTHNPAERAHSDSIFRWARLHAEEAGKSFFGSGLYYGLADIGNTAVTIEGQR